ncbi:hypothetical protein D9758_003753 [Tetrapyrgos nigripes]|uniref:Cell division control protein 73 C-terminal domain-containing protein n=1 Tax=Tetrapyrgos nigripes TaxID=182062 RepID=A0A8H5LS44_9AGAR|nr:hypothetical protein D9758_003753 [Tetrapyrgos nigripes]
MVSQSVRLGGTAFDIVVGKVAHGLMTMTWTTNPIPDEQCFESIKVGIDALPPGVKGLLNASEFYSPDMGTANLEMLSRFFAKYPEYAGKTFLSVKGAGNPRDGYDSSLEGIRKSATKCQQALGPIKKIDLFQPARIDRKLSVEEFMENLVTVMKEGKFSHIGLSECNEDTLRRANESWVYPVSIAEIEVSPFEYGVNQKKVIATAVELGIAVAAYSPLGHGFLTGQIKSPADLPDGDFRLHLTRFKEEHFNNNMALVSDLVDIAAKKGITPAQLCIAWGFMHDLFHRPEPLFLNAISSLYPILSNATGRHPSSVSLHRMALHYSTLPNTQPLTIFDTLSASFLVKPSQASYIKSTNDLLGQFQLHEAYNKYVTPFYATPGEGGSGVGGSGMGEMGADGPASPTTPGPGGVDKGKGREIPISGSTPAAYPQTPAADGQDGDDEEGGGKGEKKKKNTYKHLIKGVPGKHSMKKDDYFTMLMSMEPKSRSEMRIFTSNVLRDSFAVSLEGIKGWNTSTLVVESAQAREDRRKRKELKRLAKAQLQAHQQAYTAASAATPNANANTIQAPVPTAAGSFPPSIPRPGLSVSSGTPRPTGGPGTPRPTTAPAAPASGAAVNNTPRPVSPAVPRPGSARPPPVQVPAPGARVGTPLRAGTPTVPHPLSAPPVSAGSLGAPGGGFPAVQQQSHGAVAGAGAARGQKRPREEGGGINGVQNGAQAMNGIANAASPPKPIVGAKAGNNGVRPRPLKKQRVDSSAPMQQPTPQAMSSSDALLSLRSAIQSKASVSFANGDGSPVQDLASATNIVLPPSNSFPKSTPTRLREGTNEFYTLEAVYLAWLLRNASSAEYVKQVRDNGVPTGFVSVTERKGVVDWLEGNVVDFPGRIASALPASAVSTSGAAPESTTPPGTPPRSSFAASLPSTSQQKTSSTSTFTSSLSTSGLPSSSTASTSPQKRRYVPDTADAEAVKRIKQQEVELRGRNTVLRGSKPNNFSSVSQAYVEKLKKLKEASRPGAAPPLSSASTSDPKLQARKARSNYPIIIISSSPTALITMYNVKRFLQESTFEQSQAARARAAAEGNSRPEDMIPLYRKLTTIDSSGKETSTQAKYFIVDSVEALSKFGADAWDRVICVMTTGQPWQFKPYKWSEPRVLFHHVKGIYVAWANDPPNHKIKDWNVTELKIDQHRRHVDKSTVAHFWKILDDWTLANKPWLMKM